MDPVYLGLRTGNQNLHKLIYSLKIVNLKDALNRLHMVKYRVNYNIEAQNGKFGIPDHPLGPWYLGHRTGPKIYTN